MQRKIASPTRKTWHFPRLLLLLSSLYLAIISVFIVTGISYASGVPGGKINDPVVRAVDIAKPAVVRIITTLGGQITVHFDPTGLTATFPLSGGEYTLRLSGTGTFISAHGDILTADHVVNPPHDQSLDSYLYDTAADDIANYINTNLRPSTPFSHNDVVYYLQNGLFRSQTYYDNTKSEVYLSSDYSGPLSGTTLKDVPASYHASVDKIEKQSNFDNKDVAIVHVNLTDTPSILLGDSSNVEQQDELTIIGFPGRGDVSDAPASFLTSSVNKLIVSAIKKTTNGATVIQTGGNIEHGDSGGPALDSDGNIVGIVSFGLITEDTAGDTAFLQVSNSANELIQALNLDTTPGPFEKAWVQAFTDYAATTTGHWHKALQEFKTLASNYPNFNAIQPYLTYAQDQASVEKLPQPPKSKPTPQTPNYSWIFIVVGLSAIALAILLIVILLLRKPGRPNKKQPQPISRQPVPQPTPQFPEPVFSGNVPNASQFMPGTTGLRQPMTPVSMPPVNTFASVSSNQFPQSFTLPEKPIIPASWPCGHKNPPYTFFCVTCGTPAFYSEPQE